ncbi:alpha/beta hydrolase fold domain-containing protein [Brachybacterium sp. UMB0905]|uniref:alpha/beta hydrolase fold domain-containing protein n=1 Tax=Brachybacterium sp. UMB0905 TaxID=2069310 RepID=UPI000C7FBB7F|nr:alpha/beta hydrolase fold domain-containing protein [Brachybacterium sp. UMB0905]PMC74993.1 esterase [Brachybacterium sp. UMB0905]
MGRVRDAVTTGVRAVRRIPIPAALSHSALREARRATPPGHVQKAHAIEQEMIGRTRTVWLDRHRADRGLIVFLHGGAYVSGPFASDWAWLSRQAEAADCAALMVDYRNAPDHQHPVARDDAMAVIETLAREDRLPECGWVLAGQHSGGGLAMVVARHLRETAGVPAPSALIVMSPWLDLELSNAGITETDRVDPVHERRLLHDAARRYARRTPLGDPELSPINGSLEGLPPLHLSVGLKDLFLPDVRVARLQLEEHGADLAYREVSGRLGLQLMPRKGEDIERLHREHAELVARALGR